MNEPHITSSDIRLAAERLAACVAFDEKDDETIKECVAMLKDLALFVDVTGKPKRKPDGLEWDHIDRDPLNNRRSNFRAVTHSANLLNARMRWDNTSGAKCVWKDGNQWTAKLRKENGEAIKLGRFSTREEAVEARLKAEALL